MRGLKTNTLWCILEGKRSWGCAEAKLENMMDEIINENRKAIEELA